MAFSRDVSERRFCPVARDMICIHKTVIGLDDHDVDELTADAAVLSVNMLRAALSTSHVESAYCAETSGGTRCRNCIYCSIDKFSLRRLEGFDPFRDG